VSFLLWDGYSILFFTGILSFVEHEEQKAITKNKLINNFLIMSLISLRTQKL